MKNWLIKLLGGYTVDEMLAEKRQHLATVTDQANRLEIIAAHFGYKL